MKVTVMYDAAVEAMAAIVEEYGEDFVYKKKFNGNDAGCYYYWKGEPDCLIGKMLHRLGYREEDIPSRHNITALISDGAVKVADRKTAVLLEVTQEIQDYDRPWGEALGAGIAAAKKVPA